METSTLHFEIYFPYHSIVTKTFCNCVLRIPVTQLSKNPPTSMKPLPFLRGLTAIVANDLHSII